LFLFLPNSRQVYFWEPLDANVPEPAIAATAITWAPSETQLAIFNLLCADADLETLLDGADKIYDYVPDNKVFPYITMSIKPWLDRGNYTHEGLSCLLQISTWYQPGASPFKGRGDYRIQQIQKRVDELLHKKPIAISGWNTLILRRALIDIITDQDNVTRHGIQQFKLFLGR
jgi:hypothetical protein